jgi:hypothetical protein
MLSLSSHNGPLLPQTLSTKSIRRSRMNTKNPEYNLSSFCRLRTFLTRRNHLSRWRVHDETRLTRRRHRHLDTSLRSQHTYNASRYARHPQDRFRRYSRRRLYWTSSGRKRVYRFGGSLLSKWIVVESVYLGPYRALTRDDPLCSAITTIFFRLRRTTRTDVDGHGPSADMVIRPMIMPMTEDYAEDR